MSSGAHQQHKERSRGDDDGVEMPLLQKGPPAATSDAPSAEGRGRGSKVRQGMGPLKARLGSVHSIWILRRGCCLPYRSGGCWLTTPLIVTLA